MNNTIKKNTSLNTFKKKYIDCINKNILSINSQFNSLKKSFELFKQLKNHENIDDFCNNEAFGFLFSTNRDSRYNRECYSNLLKAYIIENRSR